MFVFLVARINHVSDVRNGERCLCDVGGDNESSFGGWGEDNSLLLERKRGIEREDLVF